MSIDLDKPSTPTLPVPPPTRFCRNQPPMAMAFGVLMTALAVAFALIWTLSPSDHADQPIAPASSALAAPATPSAFASLLAALSNAAPSTPDVHLVAYKSVQDCVDFHTSDSCRLAFLTAASRKAVAPTFQTASACTAIYATCMPLQGRFTPTSWGIIGAWNWGGRYPYTASLVTASPVFVLRDGGYQAMSSTGKLSRLPDIHGYWQSDNP